VAFSVPDFVAIRGLTVPFLEAISTDHFSGIFVEGRFTLIGVTGTGVYGVGPSVKVGEAATQ
jgi:hypothetical protein